MKKISKDPHIRRNRLSYRIAILAVVTSILAIAGLELMRLNMQRVVSEYDHMVNVDYDANEMMGDILSSMYKHQASIFHHVMENGLKERDELESASLRVEGEIKDTMAELEQKFRGTDYEKEYHGIYSGVTSYFSIVEKMLDFSKDGDKETAQYYLKTTLTDVLSGLNKDISSLNAQIRSDIDKKKKSVKNATNMVKSFTLSIVVMLLVMTVISVILCMHIADEMVSRDMLTGVSNFDNLIKIGDKYKRRKKLTDYAGLALSIKGFKFINEEHGSVIGDIVLREYAKHIAKYLIRGEKVARNGADNFLALIETDRVDDFLTHIEKVHAPVGDHMRLAVYSRCGIYAISEDDTIHDVVNASLIALGDTRLSGAEDFVWFREDSREELLRHKEILTGYKTAIKEEEFVVYYQPKVDLRTRALHGCEALVRWIKNGEMIPPNSFIPVLEEDGKIQELDFYVFEKVCKDISDWQKRGMIPVRVSSNFSKLHLHDPNFTGKVKDVINRYGVDTKYLEAELTESSGYEDYDALEEFVSSMREIGVQTAMDDFGTGFSSLSLLRDIEMNVIKLDRSFLRNIDPKKDSDMDAKMISNIVKMIHDLDRYVICEGVETKEQAQFLLNIGCYMAQGYYFDKPLPVEEFEKRLLSPKYDR